MNRFDAIAAVIVASLLFAVCSGGESLEKIGINGICSKDNIVAYQVQFLIICFCLATLEIFLNDDCELDAVGEVVEDDIDVMGAADGGIAHEDGDTKALGEELVGVELGDDGAEDLVADGAEDLVVVLGAHGLEDGGEGWDAGAGEQTEGELHHLETGADVWLLESRDEEVSLLVQHVADPIEQHDASVVVDGAKEGRAEEHRCRQEVVDLCDQILVDVSLLESPHAQGRAEERQRKRQELLDLHSQILAEVWILDGGLLPIRTVAPLSIPPPPRNEISANLKLKPPRTRLARFLRSFLIPRRKSKTPTVTKSPRERRPSTREVKRSGCLPFECLPDFL